MQKTVPEGRHTGKISRTELRDVRAKDGGTVQYLDVFIAVEGSEGVEIKVGCPLSLGRNAKGEPTTKLSRVAAAAGLDITKTFESAKLIGKRVSFAVVDRVTENGIFADIVPSSIVKPA